MKVKEVFDFLNGFAPFLIQEEWDNAGFLVGDMGADFSKALVALDVTKEVIDEAVALGASLIVSHHPVIFKAQKTFTIKDIAYLAVRNNISIISAHTNFDAAKGGVNDVLANLISLENIKPLFAGDEENAKLRQGTIQPMKARDFAKILSLKLKAPTRFCLPDKQIEKIGLCGGSGASFLNDINPAEIDALVTGDAGHHDFLEAEERGIALFACGHFETEQPAMVFLTDLLNKELKNAEFIVSKQKSPIYHA